MTDYSIENLERLWNAQPDPMNTWDELGIDEIVAFAQQVARQWQPINAAPRDATTEPTAMTNRIYIAGPMSGLPDYNYPAFNAAAAKLRSYGLHVENPAENPPQDSWQDYMRQAITQMLTCDNVVMLPGWMDSEGAMIERDISARVGMTIRGYEPFLAKMERAKQWTT